MSPLPGMRRCILWGTGLTWNAGWVHIGVVMPSPTLPCQGNPWWCSMWRWRRKSPIIFRSEAITPSCCCFFLLLMLPRHFEVCWDFSVWKNNRNRFKLHVPVGAALNSFSFGFVWENCSVSQRWYLIIFQSMKLSCFLVPGALKQFMCNYFQLQRCSLEMGLCRDAGFILVTQQRCACSLRVLSVSLLPWTQKRMSTR